ncbi:MAG: phospho-N-acetylmuramoyl-pentapeptide-transferase, partial [Cyclobacteriaceae bacterium]|nr:phospho-N-acetylmuramoyl-pentapeptide-transferase [Cyclobacteriaceae bacterium]
MLYYLFDYLQKTFDLSGAGVFQYISFRAGMAAVFSLLITIFFGKKLINILQKKQVGEEVRDLGLEGQKEKQGTPTMGGLIILAAILIPTLLFAQITNIYVILLLFTTIGLGMVGFLDDYIKVFKKNKQGLAGRFKIVGQVVVGLVVGFTLYFHEDVVVRKYDQTITLQDNEVVRTYSDVKSSKTTVPFVKDNELDYDTLLPFVGHEYTWVIYILLVVLVVTAV